MPRVDPLDEFNSELGKRETPASPALPESTPVAPAADAPVVADLLSLEEIVRREVVVNWDEAVAVVEEVCALQAAAETGVPGASDLFITDGTIVRRHGARAQSDITSAGRLLHSLLSTAGNTPVPLRLFVTQASAHGTYDSIAAFASGLAYFGKAGRSERIRALYRRCATPAVSVPASVRAPEPKREDSHGEARPPAPPRRSLPRWAVAAFVAIGLSGAGVWLWSMRSSLGAEVTSLSLVAEAREAVGTLLTGPPEQPAPSGGPAPAPRDAANADQHVARQPAEALRLASRPLGSPSGRRPRPQVRPSPTIPVLIQPPASGDLSARSADETARETLLHAIYSDRDADVEPPVLLHPQIPANLMLAGESRLNIMELLVSETGLVEQVRLIAGPSRLPDVMLLSGAKAWRFKPASRDGETVRYRALVSFAGTP